MNTTSKENPRRIFYLVLRFVNWGNNYYLKSFKVNGKDKTKILTDRQFQIMIGVRDAGCNTISKLEKVLPVTGSTLSSVVSKLVRDGYIQKQYPEHGLDGRTVYLHITQKGQDVLAELEEEIRKSFRNFYHSLEECQKIKLKEGVNKLYGLMKEVHQEKLLSYEKLGGIEHEQK